MRHQALRAAISYRVSGMFRARPRWTVSASGWAVLDLLAGPARPPDTSLLLVRLAQPDPSFLSRGPGQPGRPDPHFDQRGPGRPGPTTPSHHFCRQALGQPGPPQPLTFIDTAQASLAWANPSLLLARPSLLLAGPDVSFLLTLVGLGQGRALWGGQARWGWSTVGLPTPF